MFFSAVAMTSSGRCHTWQRHRDAMTLKWIETSLLSAGIHHRTFIAPRDGSWFNQYCCRMTLTLACWKSSRCATMDTLIIFAKTAFFQLRNPHCTILKSRMRNFSMEMFNFRYTAWLHKILQSSYQKSVLIESSERSQDANHASFTIDGTRMIGHQQNTPKKHRSLSLKKGKIRVLVHHSSLGGITPMQKQVLTLLVDALPAHYQFEHQQHAGCESHYQRRCGDAERPR